AGIQVVGGSARRRLQREQDAVEARRADGGRHGVEPGSREEDAALAVRVERRGRLHGAAEALREIDGSEDLAGGSVVTVPVHAEQRRAAAQGDAAIVARLEEEMGLVSGGVAVKV